jgi:ParB/RepB/Spo0J family partition protein
MGKLHLIWAEIDEVFPNPLNPRKDYSVKSADIKRIIKQKGWETGIVCYEKNSKYIILSGHRRWYAAKELKIHNIPILIVDPPKSEVEELESLGSIQGGKVDWTTYEWAKYTYEMWINWNKCPYSDLAIKMSVSASQIAVRIKVFQNYQIDEIKDKIEKGVYSFSVLYYLLIWMERLQKEKPLFVNKYNEKMIRKTMLTKIEQKLVNVVDLKNDKFIELSSDEQLKEFLMSKKKKLAEALMEVSFENSKYRNVSRLKTHINKINHEIILINKYGAARPDDAQVIISNLKKLRKVILKKQEELRSSYIG